MVTKLRQQNGKNRREFVVEDDRLVMTTNIEGIERKTTFPFDGGVISSDYDETVFSERVFFGRNLNLLLTASGGAMLLALVMLSLASTNHAWTPSAMLMLLLFLGLLFYAAIKSQAKKVGYICAYIGNGQLYLYGRNDHDHAEVKDFLAKALDAQKAYYRKKYLTHNQAQNPDQIRARLSWLYEHKFINDVELAAELKKLTKQ